jgi:hypothetical protein
MTTPIATIRQRIDDIDEILASGAQSVIVDGVTTTFDHKSLRAERDRLERQLPEYQRRRKPRAYRPTGLGQ